MPSTVNILLNINACGWSSAGFLDTSDNQMSKLVNLGYVIRSPNFRIRKTNNEEYGITQSGRDFLEGIR